jgi:hypothetical protein
LSHANRFNALRADVQALSEVMPPKWFGQWNKVPGEQAFGHSRHRDAGDNADVII